MVVERQEGKAIEGVPDQEKLGSVWPPFRELSTGRVGMVLCEK